MPVPTPHYVMHAPTHTHAVRPGQRSMDKLFDLMMMGLKYQLLCSTKLEQMVDVSTVSSNSRAGHRPIYFNNTWHGVHLGPPGSMCSDAVARSW